MIKHTYQISGMTCNGCRGHVQKTLSEIQGVLNAEVNLEEKTATIEMEKHIPLEILKAALEKDGGRYSIGMMNEAMEEKPLKASISKTNNNGKYYCPMHCEGDKIYEKDGDCPVCGMDLVPQASTTQSTKYTCPMHPEIVEDKPGSCPICGMDLVPMIPVDNVNTTYQKLLKKFKIAVIFTLPIFILVMVEMIPNKPLSKILSIDFRNWIQFIFSLPVVFYAAWMFFERAWRSFKTWNLNMFSLIGVGAGAAFVCALPPRAGSGQRQSARGGDCL